MKTIEAVVQNGQIKVKRRLKLPDGTRLRVQFELVDEEDPLIFMAKHAVATGIPDLAERHNEYPCHPKKRR
jgi:predicted DNA-binding antitoxin AbrB/MazE fold protein